MKAEEEQAAALASLERAVQERPMSGAAWTDLGEAYGDAGHHELAVPALRRATEVGPSAWTWFCLSWSLGQLDEGAQALEAARKAVALAPRAEAALVNLGRLLLRQGRPREAIRYLERAVQVSDGASAVPVGLLGIARFRADDYGAAAECLEEALRKDPDDPGQWAALGASLDELGRRQSAVFALETAVFAAPDYAWAWGRLGKALRALGRHEDAVRAFEKSVEHGFAPAGLWADMGDSAAELRDVGRLRRACRELGRLDADLAKPLRRRLRSLVAQARSSPVAPSG